MVGYCRLPGGAWGIGGEGDPPTPGEILLVRRADGAQRSVRVGRIIERVAGRGFRPGRWTARIAAPTGGPALRRKTYPRCPDCGGIALPGRACSETGEAHGEEASLGG